MGFAQTMRIGRRIQFHDKSNNADNIRGNFSPERITFVERFVGKALNETNDCTLFIDTTSAVALTPSAVSTGRLTMTTAATITKTASYAGNLVLYPAMNPAVEWRVAIDDITNVRINVGLNDETAEATGALPFAISGTAVTPVCTNGAHFVFDVAQSTDYWYIVSRKAAGTSQATLLASKYAPANDIYATLRIALDTLGNATYYYNGIAVGYLPLAVATTVGFCPYIGIRNANGSAHILSADYYKLWGD